jgi:Protein of unknown function (DUF2442)
MTTEVINIVTALQVGDYSLRLVFDDGTEQVIDFKAFLNRSQHPDIRQWLDLERFLSFRVEYGELVWGDYDLCFPNIDLYRNDIEHHLPLESAA